MQRPGLPMEAPGLDVFVQSGASLDQLSVRRAPGVHAVQKSDIDWANSAGIAMVAVACPPADR